MTVAGYIAAIVTASATSDPASHAGSPAQLNSQSTSQMRDAAVSASAFAQRMSPWINVLGRHSSRAAANSRRKTGDRLKRVSTAAQPAGSHAYGPQRGSSAIGSQGGVPKRTGRTVCTRATAAPYAGRSGVTPPPSTPYKSVLSGDA